MHKLILQPLQTIQTTSYELILLQAAIHHYQCQCRYDEHHYQQIAPVIQQFIQRLHDQPALQGNVRATAQEVVILRAALEQYRSFVQQDRDLSQVAPLLQQCLARFSPGEEQQPHG